MWICQKEGLTFEIHDELEPEGIYVIPSQRKFINQFGMYVINGQLDWNFHFLYRILHLRKHFINIGVGIRQFMDLAVLVTYGPELDWIWIEDKLRELRLLEFAEKCFALLHKWFGTSVPIAYADINRTLYEKVTCKVICNGVFGFSDTVNLNNIARTKLIYSRGPIILRRLHAVLSTLFPDFHTMKSYPGCKFLEKKPFLLPVAWFFRILHVMGKDRPRLKSALDKSFIPMSDLNERESFLQSMGLLEKENERNS